MQSVKVILLLVCLAGVASALDSMKKEICEECKKGIAEQMQNRAQVEEEGFEECKLVFEDPKEQADCFVDVKEYVEKMSKQTPEEVCQSVEVCP